ncbi:MAG: alpha/beta fold hydrolase [Rhodothermales bacterium]
MAPVTGTWRMQLFRQSYGEGPPLLIIHGLFGASGNWVTLARNVYAKHFRTVTLDLRNHGRSPHAPEFSYDVMSQDVLMLMEEEGMEHAHIIGHSMGGKLAMHLALEHPEAVDRLVVADIGPQDYPARHGTLFDAMEALHPEHYSSREEIDVVLSRDIPASAVRQFLMKNLQRNGDAFAWGINLPAIRQGYGEIIGPIESWETFDGETLFVRGGNSDYLVESDMTRIRALFPFADMATIEGVGHWLHAEAPKEFAELTLNFLLQGR